MQNTAIAIDEIIAARQRIAKWIMRTPLVRLNLDVTPMEIWLKLENLHPIGSFKLRGAMSAITAVESGDLQDGIWTVSAGNMAQGVAWCARTLGIPCTAIMPEDAPHTKIEAVKRLGAHVLMVPFAEYQQIQRTKKCEGVAGLLIHPFADRTVMAGNGTIGLEVLNTLPEVDTVIVPYGGGGLACGIASAFRSAKPETQIFASEVQTAAPLAASLKMGHPTHVPFQPSFVSGIGAPFVFPEMWPLASELLSGSFVVSLREVVNAIRLLAERNHIIVEGAGAVAVAAALARKTDMGKTICIVSGGCIDSNVMAQILKGQMT